MNQMGETYSKTTLKAVNEIEYGKVIKQSVGYVYTESPMAEPIVDIKK
jgi:hypothetical protein